MTAEAETEKQPTPADLVEEITKPAKDPKVRQLVEHGLQQLAKGRLTLADLFQTLNSGGLKPAEIEDKKPPVPLPLTDEERAALKRLPEVYGKVIVTADRALTKKELAQLVEERQVIDTLLAPLKQRKEESIREVLANHLDSLVDPEKEPGLRKDAKGHWAKKQEVSVEGTGKKVQRSVSGGKPVLTIADVEALYREGLIDRKTYLRVTRLPDAPRVLDEAGLHRAIQKDPRLFFLFGSVARATSQVTTIKVVKDT